MSQGQRYVFMLVGKTGTGKSATGNSLLGESHFKCSDKSKSVTKEAEVKSVTRNGYNVTVIDAPGVMDTGEDFDGAKSKCCEEMTAAMSACPTNGKIAIVLVLKYGDRFTPENKLTLDILKTIFGADNLWKSCVIVMTHGDVFQINNEDDGTTFEEWLKDQAKDFGELIKECSYRCLLFNNKTKSQEENDKQFLEFIKLTEQLDHNYTMTRFLEAKKRQNRLKLEGNLNKIKNEYDEKIKTLSDKINDNGNFNSFINFNNFIKNISLLLEQLNKLDDPQDIAYDTNEPLLLHKQRSKLNALKLNFETSMSLTKYEKKVELFENETNKCHQFYINYNTVLGCGKDKQLKLENSILTLEKQIFENWELSKYKTRIELLKDRIRNIKLNAKREEFISKYCNIISQLSGEVASLPIPSDSEIFLKLLMKHREIFQEASEHKQELGELRMLFSRLEIVYRGIKDKMKESSITFAWKQTSYVTGALSVGAAFIPGLGIPVAIGLNAIPVIGKAIHKTLSK